MTSSFISKAIHTADKVSHDKESRNKKELEAIAEQFWSTHREILMNRITAHSRLGERNVLVAYFYVEFKGRESDCNQIIDHEIKNSGSDLYGLSYSIMRRPSQDAIYIAYMW